LIKFDVKATANDFNKLTTFPKQILTASEAVPVFKRPCRNIPDYLFLSFTIIIFIDASRAYAGCNGIFLNILTDVKEYV